MDNKAFIQKIGVLAQKDYEVTGVLPSITIAQAILESNWGKSGLTQKANNLFGMKGTYKGASEVMRTAEQDKSGKVYYVQAHFRKYPGWAESVSDHGRLLTTPRYARVRGAKDYKEAAQALRDCGYATDIKYPQKLTTLIQKHKLYEWDEVANMELIRVVINKELAVDGILEGGRSYIAAKDLVKLGINVDWNNKSKVLHVWK